MKLQNRLIELLEKTGKVVVVRKKTTKELIDFTFLVTEFDYELTPSEKEYVRKKLKKYDKSFNRILLKLKKDVYSRQAVVRFNDEGRFPECFISIQFLIRNNELFTLVNSRSLDVKKKLIQDIEICKKFSEIIENKFKVNLKYIKFRVGSMHFYI